MRDSKRCRRSRDESNIGDESRNDLRYRQLRKVLNKFVRSVSRIATGSAVRTASKRLVSSTVVQIVTMGNSGVSPQLRLWRITCLLSRFISQLYKWYNDSSPTSLRYSLM